MSTSPTAVIAIRPLATWNEYLAAEELQQVVWQMPDLRDAVPGNLMITAQKNGGLVLGAFDAGRLVGLAFGFLGLDHHLDPPTLKHTSHMLAVLPEYQSRKLGAQLKFEQRRFALAQGLPLMTWTFDPLQTRNANLNLSRLGAIARRYIQDAYGEMTDGLNAGVPSDRFEAEWWLNSERALDCAAGRPRRPDWQALLRAGAREIFSVAREDPPVPHITAVNLPGEWSAAATLILEIPADLAAVKAAAPQLAREWRLLTRDVFRRAFSAGLAATDFLFTSQDGASRAAYVLTRGPIETPGLGAPS